MKILIIKKILFTIKNCGNALFLTGYLLLLPLRFLRSLVSNKPLAWGILSALPAIPLAIGRRLGRSYARISAKWFKEDIRCK